MFFLFFVELRGDNPLIPDVPRYGSKLKVSINNCEYRDLNKHKGPFLLHLSKNLLKSA